MSNPVSVESLSRVAGDVGRLLVKIGGILILVLSLVEVLKYLAYLLIIHFAGGFLSSLLTLNPVFAWLSPLVGIAATVGSIVFAVMIVLSIIFAYFGYRLYKISDENFTRATRDRWILIVAIMLAIAWLSGSMIFVVFLVITIIGLLLLPLQPAIPPSTSVSSKE